MTTNPFSGPWRIVWMSGWDQDYVDTPRSWAANCRAICTFTSATIPHSAPCGKRPPGGSRRASAGRHEPERAITMSEYPYYEFAAIDRPLTPGG